jgi:uncharacterized protein YbjT (DUF2867 family)
MTDGLIAVTAATGGMGGRVARRLAQLAYVCGSPAAASSLAENYVGLPW